MKKVLIVVYYWPPSGGAGVQRWLRFVKNLRAFGWEPTIYTAKDADYPVFDEKLFDEIPEGVETWRHKVPEPNKLISKLFFWQKGKDSLIYKNQQQVGNDNSFVKKSLWWLRGNFFIPDARFLWVNPSFRFLKKKIKKGDFDVVVSTGPPHSLHLIGSKISKEFDIPWVADFRDPWVNMDYLKAIKLTKYATAKHQELEKHVVTTASKVVVVGKTMRDEFKTNYDVDSSIIHNGYNTTIELSDSTILDDKFSIVHVGSFLPKRNCSDLWKVLSVLVAKDDLFAQKLEIKLIGNVSPDILNSLVEYKLDKYLNKIDYIEYEKTLIHLQKAQVLLLPIDRIDNPEFVITGKIFEYLNAKRPILVIGPTQGDAAHLVEDCQAGYCSDFDDLEKIEQIVLDIYQLFLKNKNTINSVNVSNYSGYELTRKLAGLFDSLT